MGLRSRLFWIICICFLASCTRSTCPEGSISYLQPPFPADDGGQSQLKTLTIGRQEIVFDEVISGTLCNDTWSGTVYVSCDLQIPAWRVEGNDEVDALFFQDCDLEIAPDSIVYVEAHGDQPYYQGCSCHNESGGE